MRPKKQLHNNRSFMSTDVPENQVQDEVIETWRDRRNGVKVEKVSRNAYDGRQEVVKIYGRRANVFKGLDGEVERNYRHVKIAEMPVDVSFEVLVGLAEMHGMELSPK